MLHSKKFITVADDPEVIGSPGKIRSEDVQQAVNFSREGQDLLLAIWKEEVILV